MDNFSKEYNGYNKTEVDMTIEKMKKEFEQKLKEQNFSKDNELENLQNRVFEQEKQNERLQDEQKKLQDIIIDCMNRQEKAENIIKSTQNLKALEQKRLELLYKKWEEFSRVLDDKVLSYGLNSDLQKLADDFEYALKIVVDGKGQNDGDKC